MPFPFSSPPPTSSARSAPNPAITELKTRARVGLNALRAGDLSLAARARAVSGLRCATPPSWRLTHGLTLAAQGAGFRSWDHARQVLGGHAASGDDAGTFWHAPRCNSLFNHWFADVAEARACLAAAPGHVLLPYRRQFVVVSRHYLDELGVPADLPDWPATGHDLVAAYASPPWLRLCATRLRAPLATWFATTA